MKKRFFLLLLAMVLIVPAMVAASWSLSTGTPDSEEGRIRTYVADYFGAISDRNVDSFYSLAGASFRDACTLEETKAAFTKYPPPSYEDVEITTLTINGDRAVAHATAKVGGAPVYKPDGTEAAPAPAEMMQGATEVFALVLEDSDWSFEVPAADGCPLGHTLD